MENTGNRKNTPLNLLIFLALTALSFLGMERLAPAEKAYFTAFDRVMQVVCAAITALGVLIGVKTAVLRAKNRGEEDENGRQARKWRYASTTLMTIPSIFALMALFFPMINDEMEDFSARDWALFVLFLALELFAIAAALIAVIGIDKIDQKEKRLDEMPKTKLSKNEAALYLRGFLTVLIAAAAAVALFFLGKAAKDALAFMPRAVLAALLAIACAAPVMVAVLNFIRWRASVRALTSRRVEEVQQEFLRQREKAFETAKSCREQLKKALSEAAVTAVMLAFCAALIAFLTGFFTSSPLGRLPVVLLLIFSVFLLCAALSRIRLKVPAAFSEENRGMADRNEYKTLYALAEEAAKAAGVKNKEIKLMLMPSGEIGVTESGGVVLLMVGVVTLSILSENELRAVLSHEFAHVRSEKQDPILEYLSWQSSGRSRWLFSGIADALFFGPSEMTATMESVKYRFCLSVIEETEADKSMAAAAGRENAASALIKTNYYSRYDWESGTYDVEPDYAPEKPAEDPVSRIIRDFKARIALRADEWNAQIPLEILARNASHPTLKMRLDALGVSEYRALDGDGGSAEYLSEREKAICFMDKQLHDFIEKDYKQTRKAVYLEPLEKAERWEKEGRPVYAEEYRGVIEALKTLGRHTEAEALAERAMNELPPAAAAYGCFIKGSALAHRDDPAAKELLYRAIELNHNYIDEGLDFIGTLCCRLGDEEGLAEYRKKAVELNQMVLDVYDKMDRIEAKDDLSAETLPEGELEKILDYIRSVSKGRIDKVWLVRKTVSETEFTSAFIVRFTKECGDKARADLIRGIFNYLDTVSDWQYSLFDSRDVPLSKISAVEGSLVYSKDDEK